MAKKQTGLEPRGFRWVIKDRLAVSERVGGYGFQHRRVRREEEIIWLKDHGVNEVLFYAPRNTADLELARRALAEAYRYATGRAVSLTAK